MAIIRSYIANTKKEAFDKVKFDLGNEAIIINTRKIRRKGFLNIFKKPAIEITAVCDDTPAVIMPEKKPAQEHVKDDRLMELERQILKVGDMVGRVCQNLDSLKLSGVAEDNPQSREIFDVLKNYGVSDEGAERLVCKVLEHSGSEDEDLTGVLSKVVINQLGDASPITVPDGGGRVVFFVGPTGVGKTTTLAKIAAYFSLQKNAKVGIITEDTYRIGAVEQLRIYADILGVPLHVVYSPEELRKKLNDNMDGFDLVLVDTAGKNINDTEYHKTIKKMIKSVDAAEVHLVISAATSLNNAAKVLNSYSFLDDFKLLFTKLDETENFGLILDMKLICDKPLSYVTDGQNVASDIREANAVDISKNLLGCETV